MTKFQRGASVAIVVAIMAGVSFSLNTVISIASEMNSVSTISASEQKSLYKENGYRVIYQKSDGELTNETFNHCSNPEGFIPIDSNWNIAHSGNYTKIICQ